MSMRTSRVQIDTKTRLIVSAVLLLSTFISLGSQTMMVTALPVISHQMHVSLNITQLLTTAYTLVIGIVTPLSSNLYEKYSNRQVYLGIIGTFIVGTLVGCFANNFYSLLLARLIQACAGGLLMSFQMTTMISIYPPQRRGTILGISSLVVAFGPAIGPTLSGIILNYLNWHYLFILILPLMILLWVISLFTFPNYSTPRPIKIDLVSVFESLIGSGLALFSMSVFGYNWAVASVMLLVGIGILYIFVKRQLRLKQPLLKVAILTERSFRLMTMVGMLAFSVLLGTEQLIPVFTENVSHVSSMESGMILLPGAIVNALCAALVGRYYDAHGPKGLIFSGAILMLIATIPFLTITQDTPIWLMTVAYAIRMAGNAMIFSPAMSESFVAVAHEDISHATALNNSLRQVSGAISVTLLIVIAGLPHSLVTGMRVAIWVTVFCILCLSVIFASYLKHKQK